MSECVREKEREREREREEGVSRVRVMKEYSPLFVCAYD